MITNNIKVGDIFVNIWGYDQTNADFYQVISKTPQSVKIRHIKKTIEEDKSGFMTGHAIPNINEFDGEVINKRVYLSMGKEHFKAEYGSTEIWNKKAVPISWYA